MPEYLAQVLAPLLPIQLLANTHLGGSQDGASRQTGTSSSKAEGSSLWPDPAAAGLWRTNLNMQGLGFSAFPRNKQTFSKAVKLLLMFFVLLYGFLKSTWHNFVKSTLQPCVGDPDSHQEERDKFRL